MPPVEEQPPVRGTGRLIKSLNRSRILECLQQDGPLSRVELAERTGISLPAVSHLVAELQAEDLVICLGKGQSSGGRPPVLFAYNFRVAYIIGLDVGGTKIAGGISDLEGSLLAKATIPTFDPENNSAPVTSRLQGLIHRLLDEANMKPQNVMGVGIGVPGVPDTDKRTVRLAPGLSTDVIHRNTSREDAAQRGGSSPDEVPVIEQISESNAEIDLVSSIREEFGWPVHLDNDVNTILRGERWRGALQGVQHAVCVTIGTGIGAGLLLNGEVYRGARGAAGEIGYSLIGALGPITRALGYGPLESFAAGPGIAKRYVDRWKTRGRPDSLVMEMAGGRESVVTARLVAEAADDGEPLALEIWRETTDMVGVALANACLLTDPDVLVIGGGVSRAPERLFLEPLRSIVETMVPYPPKVVASELGEEAGILGAVATVLDSRRSSISYVSAGVGV